MAIPLAVPLVLGAVKIGADIYSANKQEDAIKAAAAQQAATAKANRELYQKMYEQQFGTGSNEDTTQTIGMDALTKFSGKVNDPATYAGYGDYNGETPLKIDMSGFNVTDDPSYKFRLEQGLASLEGSAASQGGIHSGAHEKALQEYGSNLASTEYANAYGRKYAQETGNRAAEYANYLTQLGDFNTRGRNEIADLNTLTNVGQNSLVRQGNAVTGTTNAVVGQNNVEGNANATAAGANGSAFNAVVQGIPNIGMDIAKLMYTGDTTEPGTVDTSYMTPGQQQTIDTAAGLDMNLFKQMNPAQPSAPWTSGI